SQAWNTMASTAADVLARAFPDREIVPVPCRPLIWQNGSLHCITMQLPEGILA
ncbi:MAG: agmatine deiminase family protein, partial [Pseudoxanthomonas sp.]